MDITGFQDPTVQAKLIFLQSGFAASKNNNGILTSTEKIEVPYVAPTQAGRNIIALLFIEPVTGAKLRGFSSQGTFSVDRFRAANQFQLADAGSSFTVSKGTSEANNAAPESKTPPSSPAVLESSIMSLTSSMVQATSTEPILPASSSIEVTMMSTTDVPLPMATTSEDATPLEITPCTTTTKISTPSTSMINNHSMTRSKLLSSISSVFASSRSQPQATEVDEPSPTQTHITSQTTPMLEPSVSSIPEFSSSSSTRKIPTFTQTTFRGSSTTPSISNAPVATNAAHRNKKIQDKAEMIVGILVGLLLDV